MITSESAVSLEKAKSCRVLLLRLAFMSLCALPNHSLFAQWAARVVDYQFGPGQNLGQTAEFFPANVLGPTDPAASSTVPSADEKHVCSLGKNGWVVLAFDGPILDQQGPDFVIFENAFEYGSGRVFDEWMTVSVSVDGEIWHAFPYDSLTGEGMAGKTPTEAGAHLAVNPTNMGGDAFDLALLKLAEINFVKLTDATRFQTPDRLSADLDAVLCLNGISSSRSGTDSKKRGWSWVAESRELKWDPLAGATISLFNLQGQRMTTVQSTTEAGKVVLADWAEGVYIVRVEFSGGYQQADKILIY